MRTIFILSAIHLASVLIMASCGWRNRVPSSSLLKLLFGELLFHHYGLIIAQSGDGNLLHILIELNIEHSLFFLLFHN